MTQTEGEALPAPPSLAAVVGDPDRARAVHRRLTDWLRRQGIVVTTGRLPGTVRGVYEPSAHRIILRPDLPPLEACATLVHEAAHHTAGHHAGIARADAETVAECAAFVTLAHFGLDTGPKTFPYVAAWGQDRAVLRRNLAAIQHTAHAVITGMEATVPAARDQAA